MLDKGFALAETYAWNPLHTMDTESLTLRSQRG